MENITEITLARCVAAGEPNPNTGIIYADLEEKIKEALETSKGTFPIVLTVEEPFNGAVKMTDVIGYVTEVTHDKVRCSLTLLGKEMLMRGDLASKFVQFVYVVSDVNNGEVIRVIKAALCTPTLNNR